MKPTIHFFTCSNVPKAVSYYQSNFASLERKAGLSGYPHSMCERMIKAVQERAEQEDTPVEVIHHCLDNSIQGIILPEKSAGVYCFDVFDNSARNILTDIACELTGPVLAHLAAARDIFTSARVFHDKQESVYINHTDFQALDRLTETTLQMLFGENRLEGEGAQLHRFFGSATINGNENYIPEVTGELSRRYFMKGRPGTGKSTLLKKIAAKAIERGFDTEIYHCSLDPNSLDLVIVRQLDFCVFDSTAPHEYFPSRGGDEIIDIYKECVEPGTDEKYADELAALQATYKKMVGDGVEELKKVKGAWDDFDAALPPIGEKRLKEVTKDILSQLFD